MGCWRRDYVRRARSYRQANIAERRGEMSARAAPDHGQREFIGGGRAGHRAAPRRWVAGEPPRAFDPTSGAASPRRRRTHPHPHPKAPAPDARRSNLATTARAPAGPERSQTRKGSSRSGARQIVLASGRGRRGRGLSRRARGGASLDLRARMREPASRRPDAKRTAVSRFSAPLHGSRNAARAPVGAPA